MRSITAVFTLGTIILAAVAAQAQTEQQPVGASGGLPTANVPSEAFSGFIGDDGDVRAAAPDLATGLAPVEHIEAGFVNFADEADVAGDDASCGVDCALDGGYSRTGIFCDPWVSLDYMHTWTRNRWLPPLVTTGVGINGPGTLPGASVLFGDEYVGSGLQSGGRLSMGTWLDASHCTGVVGRFVAVDTASTAYSGAFDGSVFVGRPFRETRTSVPFVGVPPNDPSRAGALTIAALAAGQISVTTGNIQIAAKNDVLAGDFFLRRNVFSQGRRRVDFILGYQFTRVDDSLTVDQRSVNGLNTVDIYDSFDVQNEFHGVELGLMWERTRGPFTLSMLGKMGMGNMRQTLRIEGQNWFNGSPAAPNVQGGFLALPSNRGTYVHDEFSIVPEVDIKLNCRITERLEASIGYSFVYWSGIALAGQQIRTDGAQNPLINTEQVFALEPPPFVIPTPGDPSISGVRDTDFWLHGLTIGLTFKH